MEVSFTKEAVSKSLTTLSDEEYYNYSLAAFQSHSEQFKVQREWFQQHLAKLVRPLLETQDEVRILTVGPGTGSVDMDIINEIQQMSEENKTRVTYHVVENNRASVKKFKLRLNTCAINLDLFDFKWYEGGFQYFLNDETACERKFDLVIFVRVFYYIDSEFALKETHEKLLSTNGVCLVIGESVQSSKWHHVYRLMSDLPGLKFNRCSGSDERLYFMETWKEQALREGWRFEVFTRAFNFDSTPVVNNLPVGGLIVDFLLHERNAAHVFGETVVQNVFEEIRRHSKSKKVKDGRGISCFPSCLAVVVIFKR